MIVAEETAVGIGEKGKKDGISEFYVLEHNLRNIFVSSAYTDGTDNL